VTDLNSFAPPSDLADNTATPNEELTQRDAAIRFLEKYLSITHCDLFFADATILIEGSAERLLLPLMIDMCAPQLKSSYLTTLEVGGAHAHRFEGLLSFLKIPYLIITDLDSVSEEKNHPACRADTPGAITSNPVLKRLLGVRTIDELVAMKDADKEDLNHDRFITFQLDVDVEHKGEQNTLRPRTFEESIAYHNLGLIQSGELRILPGEFPSQLADAYEQIYQKIRSSDFKKTDFAISLLLTQHNWKVPGYIEEGLHWLQTRLSRRVSGTGGAS